MVAAMVMVVSQHNAGRLHGEVSTTKEVSGSAMALTLIG